MLRADLQVALFEAGELPEPEAVEHLADRARDLFSGRSGNGTVPR